MKGEIPPGCAAYGLATDNTRIYIFGGMVEYGKYSNDLYEMKVSTWEWKRAKPKAAKNGNFPRARLGHSFTMIGNKIYLFGGLANESNSPKLNVPKYLNDLWVLEVKNHAASYQWESLSTHGQPPSPRESHTAVTYKTSDGRNKLLIYGGMNGNRLGDVFIFEVESNNWNKIELNPGRLLFPF